MAEAAVVRCLHYASLRAAHILDKHSEKCYPVFSNSISIAVTKPDRAVRFSQSREAESPANSSHDSIPSELKA